MGLILTTIEPDDVEFVIMNTEHESRLRRLLYEEIPEEKLSGWVNANILVTEDNIFVDKIVSLEVEPLGRKYE